ncbi:TetR/AcrR family transcriptional regulator [Demequina capsici]|uniref:TetR/AcrR family transcriptional regulator n=1 Tax=Demequina capsici TaxID=3075620 RepID=A0AA96F7Q4_9MICO|nr:MULTISPECIES: TetR/AcrR family transcriptional regulator [unclassified Demequina]WNM24814.1 TetR/AcrR family transcriptional regulator [Demequina sp. OYTSA14]WNM27721.1 TetR/AcrR family transcriptional regulator [Demequina sp. PMTSA13]
MSRTRRPRRDAIANRERLLTAAFDILGSRDGDISVSELAAATGMGVGTAYRHFPDHDSLIRAMYDRAVENLMEHVAELPDAPTAWERFAGIVEITALSVADSPGQRTVMRLMYDLDPEYMPAAKTIGALTTVVQGARAEGKLRDDVTLSDIVLAVYAIGGLVGRPVGDERIALRRVIMLFLDGLRVDGVRSDLPTVEANRFTLHALTHRSNAAPASPSGS